MFLWGRIIVVFRVEDILYFSCRHKNWIEEAEVLKLDNEYYSEPMQLAAHAVIFFPLIVFADLFSEPCVCVPFWIQHQSSATIVTVVVTI
jgi:hypothetical protein